MKKNYPRKTSFKAAFYTFFLAKLLSIRGSNICFTENNIVRKQAYFSESAGPKAKIAPAWSGSFLMALL